MASSSSLRNVSEDGFHICPPWFKTIIYPDKHHINVCPIFQESYATEISNNYGGFCWIICGKAKSVVLFNYANGTRVLTSGINVAKDYGFEVPTGVILYYEGERNNFTMLVDRLFPPPIMVPIKRYADGWIWNPDTFFKTMVFPNKGKIEISSYFLKNFKNNLNDQLSAWLIDASGTKAESVFIATEGKLFMKPKVGLNKVFGLTEPMIVYLYFRFQNNEFMMFEKKFHKIFKYGERRVIDDVPIIFASDQQNNEANNEVDEIDPTQFAVFHVTISESLATTNQVLHIPKNTTRYVLKKGQTKIYLRDVETRRITQCTIKTADRNEFEKYITQGFNDYKIEKGLRNGDILRFQIEDPPLYMNVEVNPN